MFNNLLPDLIISDIFKIDSKFLEEHSIKLLLVDIDNTLVPHGMQSTPEVVKWISGLQEKGYQICFISNNNKKRVDLFNQDINIPAFHKSKKPLRKIYKRVLNEFKVDINHIAAVGDQLLSDIWGANRLGILTILVSPINKHEPLQIRCKRVLERFILKLSK